MATMFAADATTVGWEEAEAETPLLEDVVPGSVDYKGRPSVRSKSGIWRSASYIICAGVAERFAYYGMGSNMITYLTNKMGLSVASAAANSNAWYGVSALLPIAGGFLADSFFGRFRMIIISSLFYIAGLCLVTVSTTFTSSEASQSTLAVTLFFFSSYLVALAQGGFLPCIEAFGADQFDEETEKESRAKSSFFNWWYCISSGGIMIPAICTTYIQENVSWFLGFVIPNAVMCLGLAFFSIGIPTYRLRRHSHQRNPFFRICHVFSQAARHWRAPNSGTAHEGLSSRFRFLDKALLGSNGLSQDSVCTVSDVEDAKGILSLAPIWITSLGYSIIFAQPSSLFTKQAATLDRHITPSIEIPAASLQICFLSAVILIALPLYDRVFVPLAGSITKNPSGISMLQRISFGMFLSLISIIFAAVVETNRLAIAREHGLQDSPSAYVPMSVWWLAPQYMISAMADVFAVVGLQEFFYSEVAGDLKSIGLSLFLSILGIGGLLSSLLVSTIQQVTGGSGRYGWFADDLNRAHLDYFYWVLAFISSVELAFFLYFTRSYSYRRGTA